MAGREQELSSLGELLDATVRGSGGCVVVDGPFGIGKTHLLKVTGLEAAARGLTVVAGRASVTDQPVPVHLLVNFLRHAMPGEADVEQLAVPDANPFWLIDRVGDLVEIAARRRPLVVALDDAQRIDDVSALALRGLVPRLASSPVLWLLARRPVVAGSIAQHAVDWLAEHVAVRVRLREPGEEAVADLCAGILGARPDASVLRWAARCGGNPKVMENVFSAFIKAGQMIIVDGAASVVSDGLPDGVLAAVHGLLEEMPAPLRRLLEAAGRLGHTFPADRVTGLLDGSAADVSTAIDEAVRVGLLRRDGERLTFAHHVVGEALRHAAYPRPERAEPAAGDVADDPAPRGRLDPPPGAPHSPAAVRVAPSAPEAAVPVAAAGPRSGRCGCDDVVAGAVSRLETTSAEAPRALARALRLLAGAGRPTEAGRLAEVILRRDLPADVEAQLVLELGHGLRAAGSHRLAAGFLRRTRARHDVCELDRAKLDRALADITKRLGGAFPTGPEPRTPSPGCAPGRRPLWTWLVRALAAADQRDEAEAVLDTVRPTTREPCHTGSESLRRGHRAELLAAAGRLEEARAEAEEALRTADPALPADCVPARLVLAHLSVHRGDLATASDQLRAAERLACADDTARMDWALARFHAASGRPAMMVQTLINVAGQVVPDPLLFTEAPAAAAALVRQARRAGLDAEAERAVEVARRVARGNPFVQSLAAASEHAAGLLRDDPATLLRAADLHRLARRTLAAAGAVEDAARSARDRAETTRLLEAAADAYRECGARRDLDRVEAELRGLPAHNVRPLVPDRPRSGWESLTSAELRVVRAIVDGMTNREAASSLFLSPHTVDSHLRRVFSKLDINSRVELTRCFIAHEAVRPALATPRQPASAG
ncbi:helix-turn-helix transcriptional regulator [Micromonospora chalcea]|uniref:helix-turn-helix transcriptional regulator n=1 Tax=Micromonospora chalcea TaxID=1874 RepID=UPI00157C8FF4|nr:AAA family ATPase [Micromonospora chalcea]